MTRRIGCARTVSCVALGLLVLLPACSSSSPEQVVRGSKVSEIWTAGAESKAIDYTMSAYAIEAPGPVPAVSYIGGAGVPPNAHLMFSMAGTYDFADGTGATVTEPLHPSSAKQRGGSPGQASVDEYLLFPYGQFRKDGTLGISQGNGSPNPSLGSVSLDPNSMWAEDAFGPVSSQSSPSSSNPAGGQSSHVSMFESGVSDPGFLFALLSQVRTQVVAQSVAPIAYGAYLSGARAPNPASGRGHHLDTLYSSPTISSREVSAAEAQSSRPVGNPVVAAGAEDTFRSLAGEFAQASAGADLVYWLETGRSGQADALQVDFSYRAGSGTILPGAQHVTIAVWLTMKPAQRRFPVSAPPPDEVGPF